MNQKSLQQRWRFQLTELLLCLAILSILISLLQPSLNKILHTAEVLQCAKHHQANSLAITLYHHDHGAIPKPRWNGKSNSMAGDSLFGHGYIYNESHNMKSQFYGLGILAKDQYLAEHEALNCSSPRTDHPSVQEFKNELKNRIAGDSLSQLRNTIVYGGYFYYENGGKGSLEHPSKNGNYSSQAMAPEIEHITSLLQCSYLSVGPDAEQPHISSHRGKGFNTSYIDGHVAWTPMQARITTHWDNRSNHLALRDKGPWPYASAFQELKAP